MPCYAAIMGGTDVTPTTYEVTITRIEFRNSSAAWVEFASGSFLYDIASASPNSALAQIAAGNTLPPDSYNAIRITFNNGFGLTGAAVDNAVRLRTNTGNPANQNFPGPGLTNIGLATTDAAPATQQLVPVPSGGAVPGILAAAGITVNGGSLELEQAVNFTVLNTNPIVLPTISIRFDVTNSMEVRFVAAPVRFLVIPLPPSISITVE